MAKGLLTDEEELRRFNAIEAQGQPWYKVGLPMEGRSLLFPFQDSMPGSVFNERSAAIPGLLAGALNYLTAPERARTGSDPSFNPEKEAVDMAMNTFGGGIVTGKALRNPTGQGGIDLALNAWHGTPHNIQGKFDINRVGTGEGAQVYGHGMYFGEARGTGEKYAFDLANRDIANQGRLNAHANAQRLANLAGDPKYAADDVRFVLESNPDHPQKKLLSETLRMLESGDYAKPIKNSGNLYKVDIPDEQIPKMLDWDKPLSKQSPEIQALLKDKASFFGEGNIGEALSRANNNKLFGGDLVGKNEATPKDISNYFSSIGITGIKYLDEGSRTAGKGTSNFVVFDPSTVKILEKNDIPIEKLLEEGLLGN